MKKAKLLLLWLLFTATTSSLFAYEYYYADGKNHQGYSITQSHLEGGTVIAGSTCDAPQDCKIFVQCQDVNGAVQWRKDFDLNPGPERCFKIAKCDAGYILTGYVSDQNLIDHHTFVMELDPDGNVNWSTIYFNQQPSTVGLYVIPVHAQDGYMVAGYWTDDAFCSGQRKGYIMKIDQTGAVVWTKFFESLSSPTTDYDFAEHILEVPGSVVSPTATPFCYYLTGSVNQMIGSTMVQKVLSWMVNDNGITMWQRSFSSGPVGASATLSEAGVSSIYDHDRNEILLVSNTENNDGFFITPLDPSNGIHSSHSLTRTCVAATACKLSAHQIFEKDADYVTVAGMIADYDWSAPVTHHIPFVVDFDKATLTAGNFRVFEVFSQSHNDYFTSCLGPHAITGFPEIHTPDIASMQDENLFIVGYKKNVDFTSHYDLALWKLQPAATLYSGACYPVDYSTCGGSDDVNHISLTYSTFGSEDPITFLENEPDFSTGFCDPNPPVTPELLGGIDNVTNRVLMYPSPAKDWIRIEIPNIRILNIEIYDLAGRGMVDIDDSGNQIDLSAFPAGTYFVKIRTSNGEVFNERFIKD